MAMKKKLIVGITAALVTAMCLGGSVFAAGESVPVNGSGDLDTNSVTGTTDATVTYTKTDATPTWSVNIPKSVGFGKINDATANIAKELSYSASISAPDKVKALTIALEDTKGPSFDMQDKSHNETVSSAFTIKNAAGGAIAAGGTLLTLADKETGTVKADLDVSAFKTSSSALVAGDHAFTGQFGVKITPVKVTI
ncbi:MAG: hypothetical protein KH501_09215 [Eubacterium limosum]|nr:hypothetical protein [Eubacterium limosum]